MSAPLTLLGPNARPIVAIGHGPGVWKQRHIGGILCSFQWVDGRQHGLPDTEDNACLPCMVLMRPSSTEKGAYLIPQASAYAWANSSTGGPSAEFTGTVFKVLMQLEIEPSRGAVHKMFDLILEAIPDLVDMPSEPPGSLDALVKTEQRGIEAKVTINGQVVHTEVL